MSSTGQPTLDCCVGQLYINYTLLSKLSDEDGEPKIITILKEAAEVTLSQCHLLCGFVDELSQGGLGFRKKRQKRC